MKKPRFLLVHDDSDDDFYIPVDKRDEWYQLHSDKTYGWPEWAVEISGKFTFTDPKVE